MNEWIDSADRLPKLGEWVLLYRRRSNYTTIAKTSVGMVDKSLWWHTISGGVAMAEEKEKDDLYWMPLPEPPKEKTGEEK